MENLELALQRRLLLRKEEGAFRQMHIHTDLVDFCSNDYLGFARSVEIAEEVARLSSERHLGNGATGARLISGNTVEVEQLERAIAHFHNAEAALLFNSGYDANIGWMSCLLSRHDTIIYDALAHASIRDGIRLSQAKSFAFRHNDLEDLEQKLQRAKGQKIIVVESIYSMDGDAAPLPEIVQLSQRYQAEVLVDEAHGLGVFGTKGEGLVQHLGLEDAVFARLYTYGKAMGAHGAAIVGSQVLRDYLINFARSFIYTTALPLHSVFTIQLAYAALQNTPAIDQLKKKITFFKKQLSPSALEQFLPSDSAIQCLIIPDNEKAKALEQVILEAGFFVKAILSPTVPKGQERIRFCIHAFNTEAEIVQLADVVKGYLASV